jgi:WhiB family redox-sensing transcriptional regulator
MLAERRENEEFDPGQEAWLWANARCNDGTGNLVALFFSEQLDDIARAKAFCGACPVQEACFEAALIRREPYGVWGGRLFFKGKVLAVKRPRGRPPKNPRPEIVLTDTDTQSLIA